MTSTRGYIFISDAHLNDLDEHTEAFNSLLRNSCKERVEVFLLGDIFDLWFGKEKLTFPFQKKVLDEIASLSERGLKINYIEGNRDFFLVGSWAEKYFIKVSSTDLKREIGGKNTLMLHGDTVNRGDIKYRFWKSLSKNNVVYSIFSLIPGKVALSLAETFEKKLKRTNPRFRYRFPENEGSAFASSKFERGYDLVIMGHFHREKIIRVSGEDSSKMLVCLPMWKENWRYFYMDETGGFGFKNYNPNNPLIG